MSLLQVEVSESEMTPSYTSCAAAIISELNITDYNTAPDHNNSSLSSPVTQNKSFLLYQSFSIPHSFKMPRTQNAPNSRNVIHSNLKTKQGKTLVMKSPRNADPHMLTRSKIRVRHTAPDIKEETVIVGQPPKKVKKNPKLETHFTIPNIQANHEFLLLAKIRAHDMMDEVVRELHTVAKIKVTIILRPFPYVWT